MPGAVELTGEDLTIADVWDVAVERRPVELGAQGRERAGCGARARRVAGRGAHVRRQHRVRAVRLRVDPARAGGGAPAPAPPQPRLRRRRAVPGRRRSGGDAAPGEHAREGVLGRTRRDGRAARRRARARRRPARARRADRSGRAAISRRSRTSRCRWSARERPSVDGELLSGAEALAHGRARADHAREQGGAVARQRDAVHDGDGGARRSCGRGAWRATADVACALSLEALQGSRDELPSRDPRCAPAYGAAAERRERSGALLDGSAIVESHRWCDKVQDAYSLRCAPQVHGASRDLLDYVGAHGRRRAERRHRQPARPPRRGADRLERELPRPAARDRARLLAIACAELASISERRIERLVNPSLSDGLPPFLVRGGRAQLRAS